MSLGTPQVIRLFFFLNDYQELRFFILFIFIFRELVIFSDG